MLFSHFTPKETQLHYILSVASSIFYFENAFIFIVIFLHFKAHSLLNKFYPESVILEDLYSCHHLFSFESNHFPFKNFFKGGNDERQSDLNLGNRECVVETRHACLICLGNQVVNVKYVNSASQPIQPSGHSTSHSLFRLTWQKMWLLFTYKWSFSFDFYAHIS